MLAGSGNAIVPEAAAEFIRAALLVLGFAPMTRRGAAQLALETPPAGSQAP
jgi:hypothetical protein